MAKRKIRRIIRKGGYDEEKYLVMIRGTIDDALDRLLRLPTGMFIEQQLAGVGALREAQFCDLTLRAHFNDADGGMGLPAGIDYDLVDEIAVVLGMRDWFEWSARGE